MRRAGWTLAGIGLLLAGLAGTAPAPGAVAVTARLGPITVSATPLRPGPGGTLTASVQVSTSGQASDQLDAALAAGGLRPQVRKSKPDITIVRGSWR
jgi:hypothetical protein